MPSRTIRYKMSSRAIEKSFFYNERKILTNISWIFSGIQCVQRTWLWLLISRNPKPQGPDDTKENGQLNEASANKKCKCWIAIMAIMSVNV